MSDKDVGSAIRVELLGPLRLVVAGSPVEVRGPKRRAVLALLTMAGGRAVTSDQLVDALWATEPPASARAALHSHVSRLRSHLGAGASRLVTFDGGYRLLLGADGSDVQQSRALLAEARATADNDPAAGCVLLRQALALWRGPPLADLSELAPLASAVVGLEQLRREITDLLVRCSIDAGEADTALAIAVDAVAADPLREPAVLLLMRALAVTGQAAQALQTGRAYRQRLAEEAGLDPSAELARTERGIAQGTIGPAEPAATAAPQIRSASILARPTTPLLGRDAQLAALKRLLATERLVTIVGPGGVGKTRLAVELAGQADTAVMLPLVPVTDSAAIPHALAAALGLREVRGDVLTACVAVLGNRPELLVVDNCEHLLEPVADVISAILDGCPRVTVLATSREPLGLTAECSSRLSPLEVPSDDQLSDLDHARLGRVPSVAVFLERGARVRPGFAPGPDERRLVGAIVRQLDGIPLAIELAAGRLSTFSLTDLSERLDRALDLLGGGRALREHRHRTLRSTFEWSYQLLPADEQLLFRHLAVFSDGVDLETAEEVAADLGITGDSGSPLARLVEASMMDAAFEGRTRYRMLQTLRSFGLDRLTAAGEDKAAARYLVRWAVELTARIDDVVVTEREPESDALLRRELSNLRSAWRLARREGLLNEAAALVLAVSDVCSWRDLTEPLDWAGELATDPALAGHPRAAAVLGSAANSAYLRGDYAQAEQLARAGLAQTTDNDGSWRCLSALSLAELSRGAYADVVEYSLAAAALAPRPSENMGVAALAATYAHDLDRARQLNAEMMAAAASPTHRAFSAYVAGEIDSVADRPDQADEHYSRAIDLARSSGATFIVGIASVGLLSVLDDAGRVTDALRGYREVIDYWDRSGNWTQQWVTLRNLAALLRRIGAPEAAALVEGSADAAPDAPARDGPESPTGPPAGDAPTTIGPRSQKPDRAGLLDLARQAITQSLTADPSEAVAGT